MWSDVSDYAEAQQEESSELRIWREEVARVAPEQRDRDTFGGVDAPCLVSHSDVFPSLMQGCHWGSDPVTGGSGSHGAVHSTPPGRSKQSRKQKRSIEGRGVSEAVRRLPQHKALNFFGLSDPFASSQLSSSTGEMQYRAPQSGSRGKVQIRTSAEAEQGTQ